MATEAPSGQRTLRVLTFLHSFEAGGVERVAVRLVARWREMSIDAPLFMGRDDGPLRREVAADVSYQVARQPWFGTAWWETCWMILRLPAVVRDQAPDVVFCAGSTYSIVAVALKLLLGSRCPPIVAKISNDLARSDLPRPLRMAWRAWLRAQATFVDHWIVMDAGLLQEARSCLGDVPCTVVPDPAIDELPAHPAGRSVSAAGTRYVFVGRLVAQKDPCLALEAFSRAASKGDQLTVIGDGPLRERLERRAGELGLTGRVDFRGHVPNAAAAMRDHDCLLLSSRYEGIPAVVVEALAAGLAVVATDCGAGVSSLLEHGGLGRIVPVGRVAEFADALAAARGASRSIEAGRARAEAFTMAGSARRYVDVLRRVADRAVTADRVGESSRRERTA